MAEVKSNPALYIQALAALGVYSNEALAVEDSLNGLRATGSAGIFTVAIPNKMTRHMSLNEADLVLNSMSDLDLAAMSI